MRYQDVTKKVLRSELKQFEGFNPMDGNQQIPVNQQQFIKKESAIVNRNPIVENPVIPTRTDECPELQSMKRRNPDFYQKMMNWD
jgi:hypothetical protein